MNDATAAQVRDLLAKGAARGWVGLVPDEPQARYDSLVAKGVGITDRSAQSRTAPTSGSATRSATACASDGSPPEGTFLPGVVVACHQSGAGGIGSGVGIGSSDRFGGRSS